MAQQLYAVSFSFYEPGIYQCLFIDNGTLFETPQVSDCFLKILVNPRLGNRRCRGIWPPS